MAIFTLRDDGYTVDDSVPPTHEGLVIRTFTNYNVRIMSDVWADTQYAVVWDTIEGCTKEVYFGCSEYLADRKVVVDATPEVLELYRAECDRKAVEAEIKKKAAEAQRRVAAEVQVEKDLKTNIRKGHLVKVVRGRKVAKGTTGYVFWMGRVGREERLGFNTEAGEAVWISAANVERVLPPKPEGMTWEQFSYVVYGYSQETERA